MKDKKVENSKLLFNKFAKWSSFLFRFANAIFVPFQCMLHYESNLVRLFRTIFYSLPLTLGISEEKQKVELNFFDDYIDDSVSI
jgi:hypothetical protein